MERKKGEETGTAAEEMRTAPDKAGRAGAMARRGLRRPGKDGESVRRFQDAMTRIRMVTGTRTQVELADFLDIRQSSVSDACRRQAVPPQWNLTLLAKLGVNPLWIENGTGPQYILGPRRAAGGNPSATGDVAGEDGSALAQSGAWKLVRVHSTRCLPPAPDRTPVLPVAGEMALPREWLRSSLAVLRLEADAGLPHFPRGAYVGVDTACVQPLPGEYYAVFLPGGGLGMTPLKVVADSRYAVTGEDGVDECPAAHVLGRVLWSWRPF